MMEKGFYHPTLGYWQAISDENIPKFPKGTVDVPLRPGSGYDWNGSEWVESPPDLEQLAAEARSQRNNLLSQSDWTQVADAPVDRSAWATYRQLLRDITEQSGFPEVINWPTTPN